MTMDTKTAIAEAHKAFSDNVIEMDDLGATKSADYLREVIASLSLLHGALDDAAAIVEQRLTEARDKGEDPEEAEWLAGVHAALTGGPTQ